MTENSSPMEWLGSRSPSHRIEPTCDLLIPSQEAVKSDVQDLWEEAMKADVASALLVGTLISLKCNGRSPRTLSYQAIKKLKDIQGLQPRAQTRGNDQCQSSHTEWWHLQMMSAKAVTSHSATEFPTWDPRERESDTSRLCPGLISDPQILWTK